MNIVITATLIVAGAVLLYILLKHQLLKLVNPSALVKEIRQEIDQVIIEMNRTTETNIGLLEDKINTISELLTKADKRILLLQRESEKFSLSRDYSKIIKQAEPPPVEKKTGQPITAEQEMDVRERVRQLYQEGFSRQVIAGKVNLSIGEVDLIISLQEAGNKVDKA